MSTNHQWLRIMIFEAVTKIAEAEMPEQAIELLEDKNPSPRDCAQIGYGVAVMGFDRMVRAILEDPKGKIDD